MIFYFTGTGNSLEVARILAEETGDTLVDIGHSYKHKLFEFTLNAEEDIGFVFPTYTWSTPPIIDAFISHAKFFNEEGEPFAPDYCYLVLTYGDFVGSTDRFFANLLEEKQSMTLDAAFGVRSVGNHISLYDVPPRKKREALLESAREQAREVAREIDQKAQKTKVKRNPLGIFFSSFTGQEEKPRSTKEFYTLPTCTHCGNCAEVCPTNTVTLIDGKPRWAELGCTQCFACIHRCPPHAIQYGKKTEMRGRYINPVLLDREF